MNGIVHLSFCIRLISLSTALAGFIRVAACNETSFLREAEYCPVVRLHHTLSGHQLDNWVASAYLAIMSNASVQFLCEFVLVVFGVCLGVAVLGQVTLCLTFRGSTKLSPGVAVPFYIPAVN